ncbi:hypothetical protein Pan216_37100 [Planctomycetes bacterium Pan216]|uniref:Uncharacterized protein n=1 Tax=Kolteria novifilia TaxID=2527975 RepID=A0A518B783_9BACT|nr:hypothetical protein Pan216_37100 [Planctomycetes bacterium Pan216]
MIRVDLKRKKTPVTYRHTFKHDEAGLEYTLVYRLATMDERLTNQAAMVERDRSFGPAARDIEVQRVRQQIKSVIVGWDGFATEDEDGGEKPVPYTFDNFQRAADNPHLAPYLFDDAYRVTIASYQGKTVDQFLADITRLAAMEAGVPLDEAGEETESDTSDSEPTPAPSSEAADRETTTIPMPSSRPSGNSTTSDDSA